MNKNTKGILVVAGVGALAYILYKKFTNKPSSSSSSRLTRQEANDTIIKFSNSVYGADASRENFIKGATEDYIMAWANAIKSGNDVFDCGNPHGSQKCNTMGGSVKR